MKKIIIGFTLFLILITIGIFIAGDNNKADLSSNYEEREGQFQEGDGTGHPLWR